MRVTLRASRASFLAGHDEHFVVRLAASPVEGAANAAMIALAAKIFAVPKRAVLLIAGNTARLKRLAIIGDADTLAKIAASLYGREP